MKSYWRDLVAFTWNVKTMEGRDEITAMLDVNLPRAHPDQWRLAEPAAEADGVVSGWITFETAEARCTGHVRLRNGLLLDAAHRHGGTQGPRGEAWRHP